MTAEIIVGGMLVPVPGGDVKTWLSGDRRVSRVTDGRRRVHPVTGIVLHTVHGRLGPLIPGACGASERAEVYAHYQATAERDVSWHFTVDVDGTVVQSADPATWTAWHAGHVNDRTVGIELVQDGDGVANAVCGNQLGALVGLLDVLCPALDVPRVTPVRDGAPFRGLFVDDVWRGVYGHRNVWTTKDGRKVAVRGAGDPGDYPFDALLEAPGWSGVEILPGEIVGGATTIRQTLIDLGSAGETSRLLASLGYTGPDAVQEFQRAHPPLAVDGSAGPRTLAELRRVAAANDRVP